MALISDTLSQLGKGIGTGADLQRLADLLSSPTQIFLEIACSGNNPSVSSV